jgi:hypothetical protein
VSRPPCTNLCANHKLKALSLFGKGPLALVVGDGFEPSTSGYEAYDVRLCRLGQSLVIALTLADLRREVDSVLPWLARLKLSRCARFTNRFTEPVLELPIPVVPTGTTSGPAIGQKPAPGALPGPSPRTRLLPNSTAGGLGAGSVKPITN